MTFPSVAKVAVEKTLYGFDKLFSYIIPDALSAACKPGVRVLLPFGRGKSMRQGIIFEVSDGSGLTDEERGNLKAIELVTDKQPILNEDLIKLALELKERTFCTFFEAARVMLPSGLLLTAYETVSFSGAEPVDDPLTSGETAVLEYVRKNAGPVPRELAAAKTGADDHDVDSLIKKGYLLTGTGTKRRINDVTVRMFSLSPEFAAGELGAVRLTPSQKSVAGFLAEAVTASSSEICYYTGVTPVVIKGLLNKGVVVCSEDEVYRSPALYEGIAPDTSEITLTPSQNECYNGLCSLLPDGGTALVYGVTGSGKTKIYIRLIDRIIGDGGQVILMVPEISLTPQLLSSFYARYGRDVAVIHSGLSMGERLDEWKRIKNSEANIVIGTRSAVFAPLARLKAIIIDEEQSDSYKSEMAPRYNCRDVARLRCSYSGALLVLGSATPSLQSFAMAEAGNYRLFRLPERFAPGGLPDVIVVDTSDKHEMDGRISISETLRRELERSFNAGEQSILLINRRGFNTFAACGKCKKVVTCPNCSVSLTYHSANNRMMCHYCGYSAPAVPVCPYCGGDTVRFSGVGTQRVEQEVSRLFPDARLLRMDADTTAAKNSHKIRFDAFANGEYDIMIGTQMVSKGLDFPNVTLVGVISVDAELYNDDYAGSERTFDLLTQVIGRAGRGARRGRAVIQTVTPENELLSLAARQDYESFYRTEIIIRKNLVYPPWCDLCVFNFRGTKEPRVAAASAAFIRSFHDNIVSAGGIKTVIIGPVSPPISKLNNMFRRRIIVKCICNKKFRGVVSGSLKDFMNDTKFRDVSVSVDINPASIY